MACKTPSSPSDVWSGSILFNLSDPVMFGLTVFCLESYLPDLESYLPDPVMFGLAVFAPESYHPDPEMFGLAVFCLESYLPDPVMFGLAIFAPESYHPDPEMFGLTAFCLESYLPDPVVFDLAVFAPESYHPVALFTKILTINYARKRKLTILFLFKKILTRILACKICRNSTTVLTLS